MRVAFTALLLLSAACHGDEDAPVAVATPPPPRTQRRWADEHPAATAKELVDHAIMERMGYFRCANAWHARSCARDGIPPGGSVAFELELASDGKVISTTMLNSTAGDAEYEDCMEKTLRTAEYPPLGTPLRLVSPYSPRFAGCEE
jgi:hypothetical protein